MRRELALLNFWQKEHDPPHIHAVYGDLIGVFSIYDGEMIEGDMSQRLQQMVREFINYYRERLIQMREKQDFEELPPIE